MTRVNTRREARSKFRDWRRRGRRQGGIAMFLQFNIHSGMQRCQWQPPGEIPDPPAPLELPPDEPAEVPPGPDEMPPPSPPEIDQPSP